MKDLQERINELIVNYGDNGGQDDEEEEKDEEEKDGNELIIANSTDLIISLTKALGSKYQTFYLNETHDLLMKRLGDEYSHHDKTLVIGTLANVFLYLPQVAVKACDPFLARVSKFFRDFDDIDEDLVRNTSFAIGCLAQGAP